MNCRFKGKDIPVKVWKGERLLPFYALDTETDLITEGTVPEMILASAYDGVSAYIIMAEDMAGFLDTNVLNNNRVAMHTAKFDIGVIEKQTGYSFLPAVDSGRLLDIAILYRLVKIAQTGSASPLYNLAWMSKEILRVVLDKNEMIRMTFGDGHISDDHLIYAAKDAIATFYLAKQLLEKVRKIEGDGGSKLGHRRQLQADIALYDMHNRPLRVDTDRVEKLKKDTERDMLKTAMELVAYGYNPIIKGTTKKYNALIEPRLEAAGVPIIRTKDGNISQKKDYLTPLFDDPFVRAFLSFRADQKLVSTFIKPLKESGGIIFPNYELLQATGRTSCRKPNIQFQPRRGGIRECILPPVGYVFLAADYSYIELCTLAQWLYNMFGAEREMAKMINSGIDPHYGTASLLLGKSIKNITKQERQAAKALNFGIGGGLSAKALKGYAELNYGVKMSGQEATEWRNKWLHIFPDVQDYLDIQWDEVIFPCGRRRSNCSFTVAHNTPFQGLASDGAKRALYSSYRAGLKGTIFVHDEIILNTPVADDYTVQGEELVRHMVDGMRAECPNIRISAEAYAMTRWYKNAEPVLDNGKLIAYIEENKGE
jgi:DNA polymerase-1